MAFRTSWSDAMQDIRSKAPKFYVLPEEYILGLDWTRAYVRAVKGAILHHDYGDNKWTSDDVKAVFIDALFENMLKTDHRKVLTKEYNKVMGSRQFAKDWPETVAYTIDAYENMYGQLPSVDKVIFKSRVPSPSYPRIIAAIYLAGSVDERFMFAKNRYGKLCGASPAAVTRAIGRICDWNGRGSGHLHIVRKGRWTPRSSAVNWYTLDDPESFLNLLSFPTEDSRENFRRCMEATAMHVRQQGGWDDYVIKPAWLYKNFRYKRAG